jgi:hypothetical protein
MGEQRLGWLAWGLENLSAASPLEAEEFSMVSSLQSSGITKVYKNFFNEQQASVSRYSINNKFVPMFLAEEWIQKYHFTTVNNNKEIYTWQLTGSKEDTEILLESIDYSIEEVGKAIRKLINKRVTYKWRYFSEIKIALYGEFAENIKSLVNNDER